LPASALLSSALAAIWSMSSCLFILIYPDGLMERQS
jgi:hypothetical protein